MQRLVLIPKRHHQVLGGHPWIYDNEVQAAPAALEPGDLVDVVDARGAFVGRGYANPRSKILVRLLTRDAREVIDRAWFAGRLQRAWQLRERLGLAVNCRVVFGEADGLPGLIVDKFGDALVLQAHTAGIARWQETIIELLVEQLQPRLLVARNDLPVRALEGLTESKAIVVGGGSAEVVIEENGLTFAIDLLTGQKTGFFLDQRPNWALLEHVARGARVLDCFSYVGAFALHAAKYGAMQVTGLDVDADAVARARANAERNGFAARCEFVAANVFDQLTAWAQEKTRTFDLVVLDPPAFSKSRGTVDNALRGYKEINRRALQLLAPGGMLLSCSCSRFVTPELLRDTIWSAARDVGRSVRQLAATTQSPDHPVCWAIPETFYLKSYLVTVD